MFWCKNKNIKGWLPKLQSHRGYWVEGLAQNSLNAIRKSFEMGYQMVEFDVRLTQDKVAILFHDEQYLNKKINLYLYSELRELVELTKLEDILRWLVEQNNLNFKLNIEIKSNVVFDNFLESIVVGLAQKYNVQRQVLISSFNPFSLMRVRFLDKEIFRALLLTFENTKGNYWFLKFRVFNFLAFPHVLNLRYQDWIDKKMSILLKDIPIVLWTLNDKKLNEQLGSEIHGIISDKITPLSQ